jgi:hypothetical protein
MVVHVDLHISGAAARQAHRYMKAEGKQGRRKYLRYGKTLRVSTPHPSVLQAQLP